MKRTLAAISALIILLSLASCKAKDAGATTAPSVSETEDISQNGQTTAFDEASEPVSEGVSETKEESTSKAPMKRAEVLKLYNEATKRVFDRKISFGKSRKTGSETYDSDLALKAFKDTVFGFMGIGSENSYSRSVEKNDEKHSRYIKASELTEADITDAKCEESSDGSRFITIKVKDGSSSITNGGSLLINAPIDKSGISAGEDDKDYFDHKTAQNVFDAIDEIAAKATVKESYKNAVIKATTDKNGKLTSLKVTFEFEITVSQVYDSGATATGSTTVEFYGFKW